MLKKLTKKITFNAAIFILVATGIMLLIFLRNLRQEEIDRHVAVDYLRETSALESSLREQVLEAHSFLLDNYDPLVKVTTRSNQVCLDLQSAGGNVLLFKENDKIKDDVRVYCKLNGEVIAATEQFKSKNSILVNSMKYFPTLISTLSHERNRVNAFVVYTGILEFCLQPSESRSDLLAPQIAKLQIDDDKDTDFRKLQILRRHAALVIGTVNERQALEKIIFSPSLKKAIADLSDSYILATDRHENQSKYFRTAIIGLSAGLLILLLVLLYRLHLSSLSLLDLNSNLEEKVRSRTKDLSQALKDLEVQQQILAHSTKMSALGEMAGGIAHEINTPLAAISLKAESLLFTEQLNDVTEKGLNEIISIVQRLAKIILGLRKFSRDDQNEPATLQPVAAIVDDTLILCAQKFKNNGVDIQIEIPTAVLIRCNSEQISQVLLNLLNNAYDAILPLPEKWIKIEASQSPDGVSIRVIDSGSGIPKSLQDKIMQPFFTTKGVGRGTGIGLSISRGIILHHGGTFNYDPTAKHTTFEIKLPDPALIDVA